MRHTVEQQTINMIIERFSKEVPEILGDSLAFGFICGSVARKSAVITDDIDTLIVLHTFDHDSVSRFKDWIFKIHRETGMQIDEAFPFEVFTTDVMEAKFSSLSSLRASLHYVSSATYDTMTWAEMISNGAKAGEIGDLQLLNSQANRCTEHVVRWGKEIRKDLKSAGNMAFTALTYRESLQKKIAEDKLTGGDQVFFHADNGHDLTTFDWVADEQYFTLARLMRRFMPLPETGPPVPMSDVQEMFFELPTLLAGQYSMRALKPRDVDGLHQMCRNPNVARYTSWDIMTVEEVEDFIVAQIKNAGRGECNPWAVCQEGKIIGTCAILDVDKSANACEIGFALKEEKWNQRVITHAANRMIEFIDHELGMREIIAKCEVENKWSIKLLKNLGLSWVETREMEVEREGKLRDICIFRLVLR